METNKSIGSIMVVFPFFPLNKVFQEKVVKKLSFKNKKITNIIYFDLSDFSSYNEIMQKSIAIYRNNPNGIILVSFGIFSQIAGILMDRFSSQTDGAVFIEPDFTNVFGTIIFKSFFKFNNIKKKFLHVFFNKKKVNDKYIYKGKYDSVIGIIETIKEQGIPFKLFDIITKGIKFTVIWNAMQHECWPLPLVLTEDYVIPVIDCQRDILTYMEETAVINIENI